MSRINFDYKTIESMFKQKPQNSIKIFSEARVLHEVKVFDRNGKLKKIISEKRVRKIHWENYQLRVQLEDPNRRSMAFKSLKEKRDARTREIQRSYSN